MTRAANLAALLNSSDLVATDLAPGIKRIVAIKSSVTGQTEGRSGAQANAYLNSTSSYVAGLNPISHAVSSTNNYLLLRFHANFGGNATGDGVQCQLFRDGSPLQGGGIGHGNNSSGSTCRDIGTTFTAIIKPTDTSSHSYMVGWCNPVGGSTVTINYTNGASGVTTFTTQCVFELQEIVIDSAAAGGNAYAQYYFS